jgi:hypothetical protein
LLAKRLRLPRQRANDGKALVVVDVAELAHKPMPARSQPKERGCPAGGRISGLASEAVVASAPGWAGASLTSLPRCIRPELRSALPAPISPEPLCRRAPLLNPQLELSRWRPDLPKIRYGHPKPLARCGRTRGRDARGFPPHHGRDQASRRARSPGPLCYALIPPPVLFPRTLGTVRSRLP